MDEFLKAVHEPPNVPSRKISARYVKKLNTQIQWNSALFYNRSYLYLLFNLIAFTILLYL